MFEHVSVLVSFIFAIALTHVFSSASGLILGRRRVRFSALLALSMLNAALGVIINWLSLWELRGIKHWSLSEVMLQLGWVIPNYFSCSLVAMPAETSGVLDMQAFFDEHRRAIFSATIVLFIMGTFEGYVDRNNFTGWQTYDWIYASLLGLVGGVSAVLAGWAKPRWLQWVGVAGLFVQNIWFLVSYTLT